MKTLYILRHGKALDSAPGGVDSERRLTSEGEEQIRKLARRLCQLEVQLDLVMTSPFMRALKTAEIVVDEFGGRKKLEVNEDLAVGGNPEWVVRRLNERHKTAQCVMLVGHEPFLSRLIGVLLAGNTPLPLELKKGGLCKLAIERLRFGPCATLQWLLSPGVMLGKGGG